MKPSQTRPHEAELEKHFAALFEREPMLCGFHVRQDLDIDDVAVVTWPGYTAGEELYLDLLDTLTELAEDHPDAVKLLRGRTFARAFH